MSSPRAAKYAAEALATVAVDAIIGGPISGASMNPARSLAPALVAGRLDALWIDLLAPTLGCALGAVAYRVVECRAEAPGKTGCC